MGNLGRTVGLIRLCLLAKKSSEHPMTCPPSEEDETSATISSAPAGEETELTGEERPQLLVKLVEV